MRTFLAAGAVLLVVTPAAASPATRQVTATCSPTGAAGVVLVAGVAQAGGSVRPVSTSITCTVVSRPSGPRQSFTQELPGAVAAVGGVVGPGVTSPVVCLSAWVYWSDGEVTSVDGCADHATVTVRA